LHTATESQERAPDALLEVAGLVRSFIAGDRGGLLRVSMMAIVLLTGK
jgi:hypothetical protein